MTSLPPLHYDRSTFKGVFFFKIRCSDMAGSFSVETCRRLTPRPPPPPLAKAYLGNLVLLASERVTRVGVMPESTSLMHASTLLPLPNTPPVRCQRCYETQTQPSAFRILDIDNCLHVPGKATLTCFPGLMIYAC